MLMRLKLIDWLLLPATVVFIVFWTLALTGSLPAPPQQKYQPIIDSGAKCTTRECRQEANEQALADYTAMLAWFTGVLAFVSFVQGAFLWRADRASQRAFASSEKATRDAADLAERRFLLQGLQTDILEKQKEIARLELLAIRRPELVIREVFWTTLVEDRADVVSLTLINRGQSNGRIVESAMEIRSSNPVVQFTTGGNNALGDITLSPGEFCFRQVRADPFLAGAKDLLEETFFRGIVIYEDDAKIRRRLVICRRAPKGNERFVSMGDPEYEYTD